MSYVAEQYCSERQKLIQRQLIVYAEFYNPDDAEQPLALMSALGRFRQFTMILEVFSHKILNINVAVYFLARHQTVELKASLI